jgi:hypothetical protein
MRTACAGFNFIGYKYSDFPETEYVAGHGIHIGVHQEIDDTQISHLDRVINGFIR